MIRKNKFIIAVIAIAVVLILGLLISKAISSSVTSRIVSNQSKDSRQIVQSYQIETAPEGLQNLSNTCYMSAVLQVLFRIIPDSLRKVDENLIKSFFTFKDSKDRQTYQKFKSQLQRDIDIVHGWSQQDAHQFFIKFLEALRSQSLLSSKILSHLFSGMLQHEFLCPQGHKKYKYEEFNYLSLYFPQKRKQKTITIKQLLEFNMKPEIIQDLYCIQCNKNVEFIKLSKIEKLPKYLVLHFSRFRQNIDYLQKIRTIVTYDEKLKFSSDRVQRGVKNIQYKLIGIINHLGGIDSGHYIAEIKTQQNIWYELNDQKVTQIQKNQQNNTSQHAYIMFYSLIQ